MIGPIACRLVGMGMTDCFISSDVSALHSTPGSYMARCPGQRGNNPVLLLLLPLFQGLAYSPLQVKWHPGLERAKTMASVPLQTQTSSLIVNFRELLF